MISTEVKKRLLEIIRENMIPEYKEAKKLKEEIKNKFLDYFENTYLSPEEKIIIEKYKDLIEWTNTFHICSPWRIPKVEHESYSDRDERVKLVFDKNLPKILNSLEDMESVDPTWAKKLKPLISRYKKLCEIYSKKINTAIEYLYYKNTTISHIKQNFPELYKLYKND